MPGIREKGGRTLAILHCKITIIKLSENESAVSAAYQTAVFVMGSMKKSEKRYTEPEHHQKMEPEYTENDRNYETGTVPEEEEVCD